MSIDFHSSSRGGDDNNSNFAQNNTQATTLPRLYVVPALKKALREAYVRMRTLKYKKQMARQNLYFRGFPVDSSVSRADTETELKEFFMTFGEVSNLKLMLARKPTASVDAVAIGDSSSDNMLGFGFVCYKSVEDA